MRRYTMELINEEAYLLRDYVVRTPINDECCILDLEATGPDPDRDAITQVAAVRFDCRSHEVVERFETLVCPWKPIPAFIQQLTGIREDDVREAPQIDVVLQRLFRFVGELPIVGQSSLEYDYPLLRSEAARVNIKMPDNELLDTKVLFMCLHPESQAKVTTRFLVSHYGVDDALANQHDAMADCMTLTRILIHILVEFRLRGLSDIHVEAPLRIPRMAMTT